MDLTAQRIDITAQIEAYLLDRKGWVKAADLCAEFHIRERSLRAYKDRPGHCTHIAISDTTKGYRHIATCTAQEWEDHYAKTRAHAVAELVTLRQKRRLRSRQLKTLIRPPIVVEKSTGQLLMLP